jgi:hypothetical protein
MLSCMFHGLFFYGTTQPSHLNYLAQLWDPFKNSLLIITFDLNEQFFLSHRCRVLNGKLTSKLELTMKWWKATLKQFFEEHNTRQKTVASYTFLKRVSTLDAHRRRQVRILTAVLSYFMVHLRGLSAAQTTVYGVRKTGYLINTEPERVRKEGTAEF